MTTDPKQPPDYMLQLDLRRLVEQQLGVELETIVRNRGVSIAASAIA